MAFIIVCLQKKSKRMLRTNYVRDNKILEMKVTRMLKEEISTVRSGTLGVPLIRIFLDKIINAGAQLGV